MGLFLTNVFGALSQRLFVSAAAPSETGVVESNSISAFELEQRVLYSATPFDVGVLESGIDNSISIDAAFEHADELFETDFSADQWADVKPSIYADDDTISSFPQFVDSASVTAPVDGLQLVLIDTQVDGWELLLEDVHAKQASGALEIVLLESNRDGIEQITSALQRHRNVEAVHLISHGSAGTIWLGGTELSLDNLNQYTAEFTTWNSHLSADADILIYGCDLGASGDGLELIESLGVLTGADIAASDDLTGHASLGGDWEFEIVMGEVTSDLVFSLDAQQNWAGVLVGPTLSLPGSAVNYLIGDPVTIIDPAASMNDPDSADFAGGQLSITITNGTANDSLSIDISGVLNIKSGNLLEWKPAGPPTQFGSITGLGTSTLVITFDANSNDMYVDELLKSITFENISATPDTTTRVVEFEMTDGTGGTSPTETEFINIIDPAPFIDLDFDDSNAAGSDYLTTYQEGGNPVKIVDADFSFIDLDSTNWQSLTVDISGVPVDRPNEVIGYDLTGTTVSFNSWNANAGRLILNGNAPISEYLQVIQSLTYENTAITDNTPRTIDISVVDAEGNASNVAVSSVFIQQSTGVWITTAFGSGSGANGLASWNNDEVIELGGPSLEFEPQAGTTNGSFTAAHDFSSVEAINGLHFVSRDIVIGGGSNTKLLEYGDILFTVDSGTNIGGTWIDQSDVGLYEADLGTYSVLIDDLTNAPSNNVTSFTLVEQTTLVGETTLNAGTFLFGRHSPGNQANDIFFFNPTGVGDGTTSGDAPKVLIEGDDLDMGNGRRYTGLDLIESTTTIGGTTLQSGWILASASVPISGLGTGAGGESVTEFDVYYLDVTATTYGSGTGNVSAGLFLEGNDVGLSEVNLVPDSVEDINGLTLYSSEGAAVDATAVATRSISGSIYEDVDGDGTVADENQLLAGVTVYLYNDSGVGAGEIDATDALVGTTSTDALGDYSFGGLFDGTYWVVIDSTTVSPSAGFNPTFGQGDVWAEQTYGSTGSVSYNGVFSYSTSDGAFYGGKQVGYSDDVSSFVTSEHVTRVLVSGANEAGVDSGFSFNVITDTDDRDDDLGNNRFQQGSFRQFIENANAIDNALYGVNTSQFVLSDAVSNHLYYQNDFATGLSTIVSTTLDDGSIGDFDPDHPYAQHSWFRFDINDSFSQLRIKDEMVIDGYTQSGASQNTLAIGQDANLRIELTNLGADGMDGLWFDNGSNGSELRGLAINGFGGIGVFVGSGVHDITVQGNFIGTDITGTIGISNDGSGMQFRSNDNLVGGSNVGDRNVISGNDGRGIAIYTAGTVTGNVFENNYIGVDATGLTKLANTEFGVQLWDDDGTRVIDNVISGNDEYGIYFRSGSQTDNAVIQGNMIGVGADGATIIGNGFAGIHIQSDSAAGNTIGGTGVGEGNIIGGNVGDGIVIQGAAVTTTTIVGNFIGTNLAGNVLANGGNGILINGSSGNTIGGVLAGQANSIANNTLNGVSIMSGVNNVIRGNKFQDNQLLGIDLGDDGLTTNDVLDGDGGANFQQNFPVIASAVVSGADVTISGALNSNPGITDIVLDFYWSNSTDVSLHGEAEFYIGTHNVSTDGIGNATFSETFFGVSVPLGGFVTATATSPNGSTSEFGLNYAATAVPVAPVLGNNQLTITEGNTVTLSGANFSATDVDNPDPSLIFTVSSIVGGQFELGAAPGIAITSFTQLQITNGDVEFVDNGDEFAPSYDVTVSDGFLVDGPTSASITFSNDNDAPVLVNNQLTITEGNTVVLSGSNFSATDVDSSDPALTFTVSSVVGGQFELGAATGVAITSFTQLQITNGDVVFVDNGDEFAPSYDVSVSDGSLVVGPTSASITFTNDNDAPVLVNNQLTITEGNTVILSNANFSATDVDNADPTLTFTVTSVVGGQFELAGTPGVAITSFTQLQITNGDVVFVDNGDEFAPSYDVTVSDGSLVDGPTSASITFSNDNDTPVLVNNQLTITEGNTVVLSGSNFSATDVDSSNPSLTFSVSSVVGGQFELAASPGVAITSFTQLQITNGDVVFVDNGNEFAPSYDVSVSDGSLVDGPTSASISFSNDNDAPVLVNNQLTITEGNTVVLSGLNFSSTDVDNSDPTLTFTVSSVVGGQFELAATPGIAITSFTQLQITNGDVVFVDNGDAFPPSYDVTVGDGSLTDGPTAATITYGGANDAPVLVNNQLTITEGNTVVLSGSNFSATDVDNPDPTLTFTVSGVIGGQFELAASPGVAISSFTQLQITDGDVVFVDNGDESAPSYDVSVSDGSLVDGPTSASITFSNDNDAPVLVSNQLTITEGNTVVLSSANFSATDVDNPNPTLTFTVSSVMGGQFELAASPGVAINSFTQLQITNGDIVFVDNGDEIAPNYDVTVSDGGLVDGPTAATITFSNDNDAPVLVNNQLTITEGNTVVLSIANFSATDVDHSDPALTFTVSSLIGGQFELAVSPGVAITSFTQLQITNGDIVFVDNGDENAPSYDVAVGDGSLIDGPTAATITFTNSNDAPVGVGESYFTSMSTTLTGAGLLDNDLDPDDLTLSASINSGPGNGTVVLNPDGSFVYNPNPNFTGADSFTYLVSDGVDSSSPTTVVVNVIGGTTLPPDPVDAPSTDDEENETANDDTVLTPKSSPLSNDDDEDGFVRVEQKPIPFLRIVTNHKEPVFVQQDRMDLLSYDVSLIWLNSVQNDSTFDLSKLSRLFTSIDESLLDKSGWLWQSLDQSSQDIQAATSLQEVLLGSTAAITSGVTFGYLIWLIKGGQVLAAIVANVPAWQLIDPLPILRGLVEEEDDDSLESMVEQNI